MKKILKFILGDAFIRNLVVSVLDEHLNKFKLWMLNQLQRKFVDRFPAAYVEIEKMFAELTVEKFLQDNPDIVNKITKQ
jgi:hypothetical protein